MEFDTNTQTLVATPTKSCAKCLVVKSLDNFYKDGRCKDDKMNICKVCYDQRAASRYTPASQLIIQATLIDKRCCVCDQDKPLVEFNKDKRSKDGLDAMCRSCLVDHHSEYHDTHLEQIATKRKADKDKAKEEDFVGYRAKRNSVVRKVRQNLAEIANKAKSRPCIDCGIQYQSWIMQFDHILERGDKVDAISSLIRRGTCSVERLLAEIAKCDVVCANCHLNRTYVRAHIQK